MDNDRPSLDLKHFDDICPDKNGMSNCTIWTRIDAILTRGGFQVPVIALFTKYEQFKRDIKMKLEDEHNHAEMHIDAEVKRIFEQHYLTSLVGPPPFICLESEDFVPDKPIFC